MANPTPETATRDAAIARLAADLKAAGDRFDAAGDAARCAPGCICPLERVLVAMAQFVGASVALDRGELLPPHLGLPIASYPWPGSNDDDDEGDSDALLDDDE